MRSAVVVAALVASVACVPFGDPWFVNTWEPKTVDECTEKHTTTTAIADTTTATVSSEALPTTTGPLKEHPHRHHRHHRHKHHTTSSVSTIPDTLPSSSISTIPDTLPSSTTSTSPDTLPTTTTTSTSPDTVPSSTASTWSKSPVTTSKASTTSKAGATPPSGAKTSFPYPSGSTYVDGWTWTYSAPTQTKWTPQTGTFQSDAHATSYVLTSADSTGSTYVTTTTTTEAACTPAAPDYTQTALTLHNEHRANHTANPLIWDDNLACVAQRQAKSCIFEHLTYVDGAGYGQNLAGGGETTVGPATEMWYAEAPNFQPYYGEANPGGDFESYGHFTQLVWAYTTSLGCATVNCGDGNGQSNSANGDFTVCNYYGAGNMGGFYGVYVLPPTSSW